MIFSLIEYSLVLLFVIFVVFVAWQLICIFALKIVNPVLVTLGSRTVSMRSCRNSLGWLDSVFDWAHNIHIPSRPLPNIDVNLSPNMSLILLLLVLATALALTLKMLSDLLNKINFSFSGVFDTLVKLFAGIGAGRFIDGKSGRHGKMPRRYPRLRKLKANSIFISYRRKDSSDAVGRIYERLAYYFGKAAVFKDVDSIQPGTDFTEILGGAVGNCRVLLAVIGDRWLEKDPSTGKSRLENEEDYVRFEIASALEKEIPVIPLLVRGAAMPTKEELPASLTKLPNQNGIQVRPDPDFRHDMEHLIKALEAILEKRTR
jgi:hypothetical protein